jgi:hypothetical protein
MSSTQTLRRRLLAWSTGLSLSLFSVGTQSLAATDVALVSGGFRRSIPVKEFEHLADTGEAIGLLGNLLEFSKQDPEEISKLLNQELSIPLILTSRLINTRIGEAIIRRVARIIYPIYTPQAEVSVPAIRAGIINGLHQTDDLTAVGFLKAYPNQVMAVNLPALFAVIEKTESIASLVKFFVDSPLDGLKKDPNS